MWRDFRTVKKKSTETQPNEKIKQQMELVELSVFQESSACLRKQKRNAIESEYN